MEQEKFTYTIGGKKYIQRPIVLGQIMLLAQLWKYMPAIPDFRPQTLIATLGLKLPDALAIVLLPEDGKITDKRDEGKLRFLADELSFSIEPETIVQVIEDFFDCNPIAFLFEKLSGATEKLMQQVKTIKGTESQPSSVSSPGETLPGGMTSSGDSLRESASHT